MEVWTLLVRDSSGWHVHVYRTEDEANADIAPFYSDMPHHIERHEI